MFLACVTLRKVVPPWEKEVIISLNVTYHQLYLCKRLLAVVFQVLWVDVEVIVVDCERLRTLGYAWHKFLHFKEDVGLLPHIKLLHRNVGRGNAVYTQEQEGEQLSKQRAGKTWPIWAGTDHSLSCWCVQRGWGGSLVKSGATLSTVTSRFPRITGSLAIFSGLREEISGKLFIVLHSIRNINRGVN